MTMLERSDLVEQRDRDYAWDIDVCEASWVENPHNESTQRMFFTQISEVLFYKPEKPYSEDLLRLAYASLVRMCHWAADQQLTLRPVCAESIYRAVLQTEHWRRFVSGGEEHLLAAMLATVITMGAPKPRVRGAWTVLAAWTGAEVNATRDTFKTIALQRLFGDTWTTLYEGDMAHDLLGALRVIKQTCPPLVFNEPEYRRNTPTSEMDLPMDLL